MIKPHPRASEFGEAARLSLNDFVQSTRSSVRLRNALRHADQEGTLPLATVADYLRAGRSASELLCLHVRNFGVRCARELDTMVYQFMSDAEADFGLPIQSSLHPQAAFGRQSRRSLNPEERARRERLLAGVGSLTLAQAIAGKDISARLEKVIARPEIGDRDAVDLLRGDRAAQAELLRIRNFGRSTLDELLAYCREAIVRRLASRCTSPEMLEQDVALLLSCEPQIDEEGGSGTQSEPVEDEPPPGDATLEELLGWGLAALPQRERAILARRYGWPDGEPETLKAIGVDLGFTREWIRQIEEKALHKLSERLPADRLDEALRTAASIWWATRPEPFVVAGHRSVLRALPAGVRLALGIRGEPVQAWLASHSIALKRIYLAPGAEADRIRALAAEMKRVASAGSLPMPLETLGLQAKPWEWHAAEIEADLLILEGFLLRTEPTARVGRAMRLYRLLGEKRCTSVAVLHRLYCTRHWDDPCSARDVAIALHANPHLFPKDALRKGRSRKG